MAFRRSVNAAARASMDGGRRPLPAIDGGVGDVFAAGMSLWPPASSVSTDELGVLRCVQWCRTG